MFLDVLAWVVLVIVGSVALAGLVKFIIREIKNGKWLEMVMFILMIGSAFLFIWALDRVIQGFL